MCVYGLLEVDGYVLCVYGGSICVMLFYVYVVLGIDVEDGVIDFFIVLMDLIFGFYDVMVCLFFCFVVFCGMSGYLL